MLLSLKRTLCDKFIKRMISIMKMDIDKRLGQINKLASPEATLVSKICRPSHHEKKNISHPYTYLGSLLAQTKYGEHLLNM